MTSFKSTTFQSAVIGEIRVAFETFDPFASMNARHVQFETFPRWKLEAAQTAA